MDATYSIFVNLAFRVENVRQPRSNSRLCTYGTLHLIMRFWTFVQLPRWRPHNTLLMTLPICVALLPVGFGT